MLELPPPFFMPVHLGRLEPEYCLGNSSFSLVLILSSVLFSSMRNQRRRKQTRISMVIFPFPLPFFLFPLPSFSVFHLPSLSVPPPFFSFLPFPPSPLLSSFSLRSRSPLFQLEGRGELSQRGLGRSPSRNRFDAF